LSAEVGDRWSDEFIRWRAGDGCPYCSVGRPDQISIGSRFYVSDSGDGYLLNGERTFGSALLVWRGRHVAEPTELDAEEAAAYWCDLLAVARAVEARYRPLKTNYFTHGNHIPHLHSIVLLRHAEADPSPGNTLLWSQGTAQSEATMQREVAALRELVAVGQV
jgi:diadenosine tetraphosphate (Ap4A) HIT family hydrolase